jgi:hypothetical protein
MAKVNQTQNKSTELVLTGQQVTAIGQLVTGRRQSAIAAEIGIAEETLSRWKAEPVFQAALNLAVQESFMAVVGKTRAAATMAIDTVISLAQSATDEKTRLSAALQILRLHSMYDVGAPSLPTTAAEVDRAQRKARITRNVEDLADFAFGG